MINNNCGYKQMSFMDGRYNQRKIDPDCERHTSFRTPFSMYYYTMIPFGLENVGATYLTRKGYDVDIWRSKK